MSRPNEWTSTEDRTVANDWWNSVPASRTAAALGRSTQAVASRRKHLDLGSHITGNASKTGRTRADIAKIRAVNAAASIHQRMAKAIPQTANRDKEYVARCMAGGGFCAFSERRLARGNMVVCLPVIWPAKTGRNHCLTRESSSDSKASGEVFKASPAHSIRRPVEEIA